MKTSTNLHECFKFLNSVPLVIPFLIMALLQYEATAQCFSEPYGSSPAVAAPCNQTFDEEMAYYYPEGVVYLNFHFILDANGEGNFTYNGDNNGNPSDLNLDGITIATGILNELNDNIHDPDALKPNRTDQNNQDVPSPQKLPWRFELYTEESNNEDIYNGIWFWNNDNYPDDVMVSHGPNINASYIRANFKPYGNKVINVYLVEISGNGQGGWAPETYTIGAGIFLFNTWKNYNGPNPSGHLYQTRVLNHEIGHLMLQAGNNPGHTDIAEICSDIDKDNQDAYSNNVMHSYVGTTGWTPCQVDIMYNNYLNSPSREYYVKVDPCVYNEDPLVIESGENAVFSTDIVLDRDIIVKNNAKLTINCILEMGFSRDIKVLTGGELVLDGGKITSGCQEEYWGGIKVYGNIQGQGSGIHGKFTSKGDAHINYSGSGISNPNAQSLVSPFPKYGGGGIISIENTSFYNNLISLNMLPYKFVSISGTHARYPKTIRNCKFITDDNLYADNTVQPVQAILRGVNGPSFINTHFINERKDVETLPELGVAIRSYGSGFSLLPSGPSNNQPPRPKIEGYHRGIEAFPGYNNYSYSVRSTDFFENVVAVSSMGVDNLMIVNSLFEVGGLDMPLNTDGNDLHEGIAILTGTNYTISNNDFFGADNSDNEPFEYQNPYKWGLRILNSGMSFNKVNNNRFWDLNAGCLADGLNRSTTLSESGLVFLCNENNNPGYDASPSYDFIVRKLEQADGILLNQGSISRPTRNTFSHNEDPVGTDFRNQADWAVLYWFYKNNQYQTEEPLNTYSSISFFNLGIEEPGEEPCGDIGVITELPDIPLQEEITAFYYYSDFVDSISYLLDSLIDGGNTSALEISIQNCTSPEKATLSSQISGITPYLSSTALLAITERDDLFMPAEIDSIIKNNSQFYLFPEVNENLIQLWSYDIDSLAYIFRNRPSNYIAILSNLSHYSLSKNSSLRDVIKCIMTDTTGMDTDSVRYWLNNIENIEYKYSLVDLYNSETEFNVSDSILDLIGKQFVNSSRSDSIHNKYLIWQDLVEQMPEFHDSLISWIQLKVDSLNYLASSSISKPAAKARALLFENDSTYDYYWYPMPIDNVLQPRSTVYNYSTEQNTISAAFAPNPFSEYAYINFPVNDDLRYLVKVVDVIGNNLLTFELTQGYKHYFPVNSLKEGIYFVCIYSENRLLTTTKVLKLN